MEPVVAEEPIPRQPPETRAINHAMLANNIGKLEMELQELRGQVQGKTP